jgi:hypothetical protein
LFTNGGTLKDVTRHDAYHGISQKLNKFFFFSLYHFEHIYLIHGKIGHIIIWSCAMGVQVHYHIICTMILLMILKPHDLTFGLVVYNDY